MNQRTANQASSVLDKLIRDEEHSLATGAALSDKRLALLEICRASDMFFLTVHQHSDELVGLYRHGCNRAIKLFLDTSCNLPRAALYPSTPKTMGWANAVIQHCGRLSLCEKLLEYEQSGLGTLTLKGSTIHFHFTARHHGLESLERDEFAWVSNLIHAIQQPARKLLDAEESDIREQMRPLVRRWEKHFIGYGTTPEVDSFFHERGSLLAQKMFGQDSFHGDASFGGLPFNFYRALVSVLIGWGLKHITFASLLVENNPDLLIQNQITLTADIDKFTEYMAAALGTTTDRAQRGLAVAELNLENIHRCCIAGNVPPPLIRISAEQYLKMPSGMLNGPFHFMLRNLRHLHPTDWDRAVNGRESIFRDELYALFPQERLIKKPRGLQLRRNGRKATDIDAVVIDPENRAIGFFQLKWQDSFESSMKERSAKLRNFVRETNQWISTVRAYIESASAAEMARILNVSVDLTRNVSSYRLFVIGRTFAHFSGNTQPDPGVAWGLWPQVLRLMHEKHNNNNPIVSLHTDLREQSPLLKPPLSLEQTDITLASHNVVVHPPTP